MSRLRRAVALAALVVAVAPVAATADDPPATPEPGLEQQIDGDQAVATDEVVRDRGHVDLGPRFADGAWELMVHDDTDVAGSVWRSLDRTVFQVDDTAVVEVPDDPAYGFVGVPPGSPVHVVPQTQSEDVVWIGWNTQDPEVMASVDRGVTLSLTGVEGPGELVVYLQDGGFGEPDVLWDSTAIAEDAEAQPIFVDVNTHTHANWVFTEPGVYLVSIEARALLVDGSEEASTGTLRVAVGDDTSTDEALAASVAAPAADTPVAEPDSAAESAPRGEVIDDSARLGRGRRRGPAGRGPGSRPGPRALGPTARPGGSVTALVVRDLVVDLGGRPVLEGVDLALERGELVGLIGPNGAGKTTLLRAVLGLLPVRAGSVRVEGRPVRRRTAGIGYVPQRHEFAWDFPIDVEHVVLSGLTGRLGLRRRPGVAEWQAVGRALDLVRMTDLRRRPVGELSGGQRQRVLVARALVLDPTVLLLDEPFTGLDLPTQEVLLELFTTLSREGRAVLMTTHDIVSALYSCDRVALINRRIVADGPVADLRSPALWTQTFGVSETHPLLRILEPR